MLKELHFFPVFGNNSAVTTTMAKQTCLDYSLTDDARCLEDLKYCKTGICDDHEVNCHSAYKSNGTGSMRPFFMACWKEQQEGKCRSNVCVLEYDAEHDVYSCCCTGPLCNQNIVFPPITTQGASKSALYTFLSRHVSTRWKYQQCFIVWLFVLASVSPINNKPSNHSRNTLFYVSASLLLLLVLFGLVIYLFVRRKRRTSERSHLLLDINAVARTSPIETRPAQLLDFLHHGRMSSVLKGIYLQREVAIKVIHPQHQTQWLTEKGMFEKYDLKHENLLSFITAEIRQQNDQIQYWIVTEYHQNGSLENYLREYVISPELLLKMLYSIVKGLVYLHSGDATNGRPMVAHRDIKSGNILVKKDLSCCIADLGLALPLSESSEITYDQCQVCVLPYRGKISSHAKNLNAFLRYFSPPPDKLFCFASTFIRIACEMSLRAFLRYCVALLCLVALALTAQCPVNRYTS